jgi:hypothetical protein
MPRHLLFFGEFFGRPLLFPFFLCGADVISEQSTTRCFKEISFAAARLISVTNMSLDTADKPLASCCVLIWRARRSVFRYVRVGAPDFREILNGKSFTSRLKRFR